MKSPVENAIDSVIEDRKRDRTPKQIGEYIGNAIAIWFTFVVLATLTGAWVKIFWLGWVFAK